MEEHKQIIIDEMKERYQTLFGDNLAIYEQLADIYLSKISKK